MLSLITHNEGKRHVEKYSRTQYSAGVSDFPLWFSISCWGSVSNTRHENIIRRIVTDSHLNKSLCVFAWQGEPRAGSPPDGTPGGYCMHIRRLLAGRTSKKKNNASTVDATDHHRALSSNDVFRPHCNATALCCFATVKCKYNLRYARDDRGKTWDRMLFISLVRHIFQCVYFDIYFIYINLSSQTYYTSRYK